MSTHHTIVMNTDKKKQAKGFILLHFLHEKRVDVTSNSLGKRRAYSTPALLFYIISTHELKKKIVEHFEMKTKISKWNQGGNTTKNRIQVKCIKIGLYLFLSRLQNSTESILAIVKESKGIYCQLDESYSRTHYSTEEKKMKVVFSYKALSFCISRVQLEKKRNNQNTLLYIISKLWEAKLANLI